MTITLKPEHEQFIAEALRTGAYENPEEVIGRALEMLHSEDECLQDQRESLEAKIERSFAQFECGEFLSPDESRFDMETRKASWLARQRNS
ncbi:MAG TPA: type II toxin-antitoxin system ParD family antitoxin [Bryobacteraceae bacterium]|nr:type II toxin-antitoxin system ParD family antitoxin [Bryobacteraceae bacterium]